MRCICYSRFSPRPDSATSDSNLKQLAALKAYAAKHGWTVDDDDCFSDEDLSGADWGRPGLFAAISALRPGTILLAYNIERIARDSGILAFVLAKVFAAKAELHTIDGGAVRAEDPVSRLLCTIMGALAEFDRNCKSKRSKNALQLKLAAGVLTGYPLKRPLPYGWRWINKDRSFNADGKNVEPDPHEVELKALMEKIRGEGMQLRNIAKLLTGKGSTYRGVPWNSHRVLRVLQPGARAKKVRIPRG